MVCRSWIHWGWCVGLTLQLFAVGAKAQEPAPASKVAQASDSAAAVIVPPSNAPAARSYVYPFTVRARAPAVRLEVHTVHDDVVARCLDTCQLLLPRGDYHAMLFDGAGKTLESVAFSVSGPGWIDIEPSNPNAATLGLVLGATGTVLLPTALLFLMSGTCIDECEPTTAQKNRHSVGLVMLGLGAVLTPIGWVIYSHNHSAHVNTYAGTELRIAIAPARDGAAFGLVGRF